MTDDDEKNLEHRLGEIERNADSDHKALVDLRKEFDALKKEVGEFIHESQKTDRLLMWMAEQVRATVVHVIKGNPAQAEACVQTAYKQLEELKTRLHQ
jgi:hypothetical protein